LIHCAKMINSKIESTWMVGDSPVDIRASKSAGCTSIGVVYHEEFLEVLSSEKPDILVRSLSELKLSGSN
jgi:phosphoglycolate phosphatase-like HAD superfamily hydrolase